MYILFIVLVSMLYAYETTFVKTTFKIGKSLSDTGSPRGFQDAITPPWSTNLAIVTYILVLIVIGYGWYEYGWAIGIAIVFGFLMFASFCRVVIFSRLEEGYIKDLIVRSMMNRYANFKKTGDDVRANAMADLLERMNVPISDVLKPIDRGKLNRN